MTDIRDTRDVPRHAPPHRSYSEPFWEGTRQRKLLLQYDPQVGRYQYYPRPCSLFTGRRALEWREVEGRGEVYSYTIARRARPPFQGHEPFIIAVVLLPEDVQIMGDMVNCRADEIRVGLKVKPYWHPLGDGTHLLMFEPDGE